MVLIIGAVLASVYVVGQTILSKAAAPEPVVKATRIPPPPAQNIASPTPVPKIATKSANTSIADLLDQLTKVQPETPAAVNGWTITGSKNITVTPQFSIDKKSLNVDFASNNYSIINAIDYSLTYVADPQVTRLIKGTIAPMSGPIVQKVITLGTCSGTACVYDTNPRGYILRALVKTNNGLNVYLTTLTFADTQDLSP